VEYYHPKEYLHMMTSSHNCSRFVVIPTILLLASLSLLVGGCGTTSTHVQAFSEQHQIKGNTQSFAAPIDVVWASVLEVMAQRGWLIQQTDVKSHLILAHREIRDTEDKNLSHALTATVTIIPTSEQITQVIAAANKTTEMHKKSYKWWRLLWLIPLFPTGTVYTSVVVDRDTVHDAQLYQDFFTAVKQRCDEKKALSAPVSAP
jgi:hypothetical protein